MPWMWPHCCFILACTFVKVTCDPGRGEITQKPSPFIIDENSSVVLTCLTTVNVSTRSKYLWEVYPGKSIVCQEDNYRNTCTYRPLLLDGDRNITCNRIAGSTAEIVSFEPVYKYPPQAPPSITIDNNSIITNAPSSTLGPGSVVKCDVRGGNPLVSNINLTCDSPHHQVIFNETDQASVTSYVNVTNLQDEDGNTTCTCSATWEPPGFNISINISFTKMFEIMYPPPTTPNITVLARNTSGINATDLGFFLGPGSVLMCEVTGGRPLVSNITFTCDSPHHPDMPDLSVPESVASYINVTNLQDEDGNITCSCFATWDPRPDLYQSTSLASLEILYVPMITNFIINQQQTTEDENITVKCAARGRPAPHVYLYDNTGRAINSNVTSSPSDVETYSSAVIIVTGCQQTGWYSCEANNFLPNGTDSRILFLNVTCPPTAFNNTFTNSLTMSDDEVLNFTLKANPPPHDFDFKLLAAGTDESGNHSLPLYNFQASCSPYTDKPYLVRCSVVAVQVASNYLRLYQIVYNATAISTEGNFSFLLLVNTTFKEETKIKSFSINNNSMMIIPEHTLENASLKCIAKGRPTPNIIFYDNNNATITSGFTCSTTGLQRECSVTFIVTSCQQTGFYKCVANNALPNSQSEHTVIVNVTAPPEAADSTFNGTIPIISLASTLNFSLKANPPPHTFLFHESDRQDGENNTPFSDLHEFHWSCSPDPARPYLARCSVKTVMVPSDYLGLYNATAVSTLGNFSFLFLVNTKGDQPIYSSTILLAVILPLAVFGIVVAAVVIYLRRRLRAAKQRKCWHAATKTKKETTIQNEIKPKINTAENLAIKTVNEADSFSRCKSNSEDENGSKINPEYLSSTEEEQTMFSISNSQKLSEQSPTSCFPNAANPYCITYVGDEPGAVPNFSATPYSVTYVGDEKITASSGLPQSSPLESDLTGVAVDDKILAVLNNQMGQVASSTNPYSKVNNHVEILPEDKTTSETKDFADGLYQMAFPPNGSTPSPFPFTPQAVPLHTDAGYAIPNLKKTVRVKETGEVSEYNTINLASSSQAQGRDLDDTYDHLLSTDTTPL